MALEVSRRGILAGALLAAGAGALAACGKDSSGDQTSGPVTVKFLSLAWQKESLAANKDIVAAWNKANPNIQVSYLQGDWDSVQDQLQTSFEGGGAPDVIHYDGADIGGFLSQGYLADLKDLVPAGFKASIPQKDWDSVTFDGKVAGVPFLLESQVIIANKALLDAAGIAVPAADAPWTWDQFQQYAKALSTGGVTGVAWALKSPTNRVLNLALNFDGKFFYPSGSKTEVRFGDGEKQVPQRLHDMLYTDKSAATAALGMSGTDALPGFFGGKYAMLPGSVSLRQQMVEQAPAGFNWVTVPPLKGDSANQASNPQTLSISADSKVKKQAMQFIADFLGVANMAKLGHGDWLIPTNKQSGQELLSSSGGKQGWDVAVASGADLVLAPFQQVNGYPEWKTKYATPALQDFFANKISLDQLGKRLVDGGQQVLK
jgi:ABC-type glycerol-3-phosphate transport system substrate-binding protein